jgi:hypothetical protein
VPQYKYREYTISIATMRVGDAIKVDTEIFVAPDDGGRVSNRLRTGTTNLVSVAPLKDVLREALESAKHTADLLAEQSAPRKVIIAR